MNMSVYIVYIHMTGAPSVTMTGVPADLINELPAGEINKQVAEYSTDKCILNVSLRDMQHDIECDKADPLNYMYHSLLPAE